jgi:hypothetical protein
MGALIIPPRPRFQITKHLNLDIFNTISEFCFENAFVNVLVLLRSSDEKVFSGSQRFF